MKSVKFSLDNPGTRSGPDLAEARPSPYPFLRPPSPTVTRKKWKRINQLAQNRKWRYWCSKSTDNKTCKSLLECPTITALVACDSKPVNDTELLKSCLSGGKRILIFAGKPTKNVTVKYLTNHMHGLCFLISFTSVFFCAQKNETHRTYVQHHKRRDCTTWGPRCDSLTTAVRISHTSLSSKKAPVHRERNISYTREKHVKENAPKWLQLLGSRFEIFSLFLAARNRTQLSLSLLMHRMLCGQFLLEHCDTLIYF